MTLKTEIIFNIVNKLDSENALSIKNAKKYLANPHIKNDLIEPYYKILVVFLHQLQNYSSI